MVTTSYGVSGSIFAPQSPHPCSAETNKSGLCYRGHDYSDDVPAFGKLLALNHNIGTNDIQRYHTLDDVSFRNDSPNILARLVYSSLGS